MGEKKYPEGIPAARPSVDIDPLVMTEKSKAINSAGYHFRWRPYD